MAFHLLLVLGVLVFGFGSMLVHPRYEMPMMLAALGCGLIAHFLSVVQP